MRTTRRRDRRHVVAKIDPEFRIALAESDRGRARFEPRKAERRQHCFIEARGGIKIAHRNGNVVDHGGPSPGSLHSPPSPCKRGEGGHAGAPDFTSLKTIESIKAWNEASMIFGDTPIVVQRSPASSSLSMSTRVTAAVPPLRMRTRKSVSFRPSIYFWYLPRSLRSARSSALTGPLPLATDKRGSAPSSTSTSTVAMVTVTSSPTAL